jgi:glutathionylspermidine synthase
MRRIACEERPDWRDTASKVGFSFHSLNGEPYWDESAYYAFTLEEIERDIEAPTGEIDAMCRELVSRAVDDERMLRALRIPERFWTYIAASWKRGDPSLYGRLDFAYDGCGPAKLLEYNADTPTSLFESAVFQWLWLEEASARNILPRAADQYNSLHECLIAGWRAVGTRPIHLCGVIDDTEDAGTLAYLQDTAHQAGLATTVLDMDGIGRREDGVFVDLDDRPIECAFKLYPWEWMMQEEFGSALAGASTRWLEPPWKAILSNKGILPLLWELFPRHPNLLPAYFEDDAEAVKLGRSYARKPLYSREGANIALVVDGRAVDTDCGPYGREGHIRQALAPMAQFAGNYAVIGSWIAGGKPCGVGIREDSSPITKNTSRFLPHAILDAA